MKQKKEKSYIVFWIFVDNGNISEAKKQICELTSNRDLKI